MIVTNKDLNRLLENAPLRRYPAASPWKKRTLFKVIKESIIKKTYTSENLPSPLFAKEGKFLPLVKGGRRDLILGVHIIMD